MGNGLRVVSVGRLELAVVHLESGGVVGHPPYSVDKDIQGLARLCAEYEIEWSCPDRFRRLAVALGRSHRPEAFKPGGRELTEDERALSIWMVLDRERIEGTPDHVSLERLRPILHEYGIIRGSEANSTLLRLLRRGNFLALRYGQYRFRPPRFGRPSKRPK